MSVPSSSAPFLCDFYKLTDGREGQGKVANHVLDKFCTNPKSPTVRIKQIFEALDIALDFFLSLEEAHLIT